MNQQPGMQSVKALPVLDGDVGLVLRAQARPPPEAHLTGM